MRLCQELEDGKAVPDHGSVRHSAGTLPDGETFRICAFASGARRSTPISENGSFAAVMANQAAGSRTTYSCCRSEGCRSCLTPPAGPRRTCDCQGGKRPINRCNLNSCDRKPMTASATTAASSPAPSERLLAPAGVPGTAKPLARAWSGLGRWHWLGTRAEGLGGSTRLQGAGASPRCAADAEGGIAGAVIGLGAEKPRDPMDKPELALARSRKPAAGHLRAGFACVVSPEMAAVAWGLGLPLPALQGNRR